MSTTVIVPKQARRELCSLAPRFPHAGYDKISAAYLFFPRPLVVLKQRISFHEHGSVCNPHDLCDKVRADTQGEEGGQCAFYRVLYSVCC
jgi:hypothetical protein